MNKNVKSFIFLLISNVVFYIILIVFFSLLNNPIFSSYEAIFSIYNQSDFPSNIIEPFKFANISPIFGFFIGIGLSLLIILLTSWFNRIRKKKYPLESLDFEDDRNFLWLSFKRSILAMIFSVNITFQIVKNFNLSDLLLNISFDEGETLKLIYSFYGLLPFSIFITSIVYSAVWLIDSAEIYFTYEKNGEIINRHKISIYFINLLRNYTAISTFLMIILTGLDLQQDFVNLGVDNLTAILGSVSFIVLILFVFPLYFYGNLSLVYLFSPGLEALYSKIIKKKKNKKINLHDI